MVDRVTVYSGAIPLETDVLSTNKNMMIGLGTLAQDVFGSSVIFSGLACAPSSPASLTVVVAPGRCYSMQNVDGTAYSSLPSDTTHQVVKQGIRLDALALALAPPGTAGQSINYLIEASYADVDAGNAVLSYYNASNPAVPFSGAGNSGVAQPTVRQGFISIIAKAGVAATTGSQATPAADTGYTGLYVVTVANGQTTITSANITTLAGAPLLNASLPQFNGVVGPNGNWTIPVPASGTTLTVNALPVSGGLTVQGAAGGPAALGQFNAASGTYAQVYIRDGQSLNRAWLLASGFNSIGRFSIYDATSLLTRFFIEASGNVCFPTIGTTASAANAFLDPASNNNLLRSTSSIRYKCDVETLDSDRADALLQMRPVWYRSKAANDRKDWGFYGLIAEEVAKIDPRLVHWTREQTGEKEVEVHVPDQTGQLVKRTAKEPVYSDTMIPDAVQYERLSVFMLDMLQRMHQAMKAKGVM